MQKSMVHELNSLTNSTIFGAKASFITTHLGQAEFSELRRSRIQNLPNHRKEDLSNKLNFVVVFQTIQIERLSEEVQTLRIKLKDYQRQIFNYQNYEVQIRELTEKCHSYEMQRYAYEEEREKMNLFCQNLYNQLQEMKARYADIDLSLKEKYKLEKSRNQELMLEVERWRARYNSLQISKSKQLQDMRMMMESQRRSMISREIKELTIRYQSEITSLQSQLRKCREELQYRNTEIRRLNQQIQGFQVKQNEFKEVEQKMYDFQGKFVMLSQQNYRLNELLRWRNEEIDKLKNGQRELRVRLESIRSVQTEAGHLKIQIQTTIKQIHEYQIKCSRLEDENQRLRQEGQRAREYERLVDQSATEIERLNIIIHQKINDSESFKNQIKNYQSKLSSFNANSEKQISNYEEKIKYFTDLQEKNEGVLKGRLVELESWKTKYGDLERRIQGYEAVQRDKQRLEEQMNLQVRNIEQYKSKIMILEENIKIMEDIERKLKNQESLKRELIGQRDRLNGTIRNLTINIETLTQKNGSLTEELSKYGNIQTELLQYQNKIKWMTKQIDRINNQLHQRIQELNQLRESFKSLSLKNNNYQNLESKLVQNLQQMQTMVLSLDETRRQNDRIQNDLINADSQLKKCQNEIMSLNQQKYSFTNLINQKTKELEQSYKQIESLSSQVRVVRQLQASNRNLLSKVESLQNSYRQIETRYKNQVKKSQQFSMQVQKLNTELIKLNNQPKVSTKLVQEILFLKKETEDKELMINSLKSRIATIQKILGMLKTKVIQNHQIANDFQQRVINVSSRVDSFSSVFDYLARQDQQIIKLREENIVLEGAAAKMGPLGIEMVESVRVSSQKQELSNGLSSAQQQGFSGGIQKTYTQLSSNTTSAPNLFTFKESRAYPQQQSTANISLQSHTFIPQQSNVSNFTNISKLTQGNLYSNNFEGNKYSGSAVGADSVGGYNFGNTGNYGGSYVGGYNGSSTSANTANTGNGRTTRYVTTTYTNSTNNGVPTSYTSNYSYSNNYKQPEQFAAELNLGNNIRRVESFSTLTGQPNVRVLEPINATLNLPGDRQAKGRLE